MIKMIATDIDGTILNWGGEFSPAVVDCIKELDKNGIKIVLVTGRMHGSTAPIAEKLGLKNPIVSYQGGLIKDIKGNTLFQKQLPDEYAKKIIEWAHAKGMWNNFRSSISPIASSIFIGICKNSFPFNRNIRYRRFTNH